ncbi:hypothetical protein FQN50_006742 [Emmonsiellopsis sp. PD_5]|nr:hypothetical protein FQN50_006742 [Emmonsiellopsis sp. PD_5]
MAELSQEDRGIIKNHPLTGSVGGLRGVLQEAEEIYQRRGISYDGPADGPADSLDQLYRNAILKLLSALLGETAADRLSNGDVASDLADLFKHVRKGHFCYDHYRELILLVIQRPPAAETRAGTRAEIRNVELWNVNIWKAVLNLIAAIPRTTPPASVPPTFDGTPVRSTSSSQKGSEQTRELVNLRIFKEIRGCTF